MASSEEKRLRAEIDDLRLDNARLREQSMAVATANATAAELVIEVEEAHEALDLTNQKLRAIINNVEFGFLIVDQSLRISDEVTLSCSRLFQCETVASRQLNEVLSLDASRGAELQMAIDAVFEDFLPEELSCIQIPSRFQIGATTISMTARALRDEEGAVSALLFSVVDTTALESEQSENLKNRALLRILHDRRAFLSYVDDLKTSLEHAVLAIGGGDQVSARRHVHTVKGNSAIFGLVEAVESAHQVEEESTIETEGIRKIEGSVRDFLSTHYPVLSVGWDAQSLRDQDLVINAREIAQLKSLLRSKDLRGARHWTEQVDRLRAATIWGPVEALVTQLGQRYGKDIVLNEVGGHIRIQPESYAVFRNLHHLLRNAVVHGIEAAGERGEKAAQAQVRLSLEESDEGDMLIEVQDDGRGIDVDGLGRKQVEKGLLSEEELASMSPDERLKLILRDGVSSLDAADDAAGRGVGMAALHQAVLQAGGKLEISTSPGQGTLFRIAIPNPADRRSELQSAG